MLADGGRDAVAVYLGNPAAHSLGPTLYGTPLIKALGTKNIYSASTVDQMPKQVASGLMFGGGLSVAVPDVDRTDHLLILGANPLVSNGSLLTAPDMRGRIRAIRERGGKVVVVDPRRSRTAKEADEHHFIRPGTDAHLLFAIAQRADRRGPRRRPAGSPSSPTAATRSSRWRRRSRRRRSRRVCGIDADEIRRIARELAAAERAAVYARIGTTTQRFGTLASWLVDVLNYLTGNLDREGGAMFPLAAAAQRNSAGRGPVGKGVRIGRWTSRVSGLPESFGELPVAGARRGDHHAGRRARSAPCSRSPATRCVSTPDSAALEAAVDELDFIVSVDIYVNETTSRADVILPAPEPLQKAHYDTALYQFARPQRGQLVARRAAAARRPAAGVGDHPAARSDRRRPGRRRRDRGLGRARRPDAHRARGRARRVADRGPRRRTRSSPRSASAAAPSG